MNNYVKKYMDKIYKPVTIPNKKKRVPKFRYKPLKDNH